MRAWGLAHAGGGFSTQSPPSTIVLAVKYFHVQDLLKAALDWIGKLGPWGPVIFIGIYVVATVLFVPGSVLTLGAGAVFGVVLGSICVSISATLGATAAFLVGRYLARDAIARKIERNEKFAAIDRAVADEGWKIVLLTRLSPVFPFTLLNYAFGLTRVKLSHYVLASWIGMMPGTVMYVYLGLAGQCGRGASPAHDRRVGFVRRRPAGHGRGDGVRDAPGEESAGGEDQQQSAHAGRARGTEQPPVRRRGRGPNCFRSSPFCR